MVGTWVANIPTANTSEMGRVCTSVKTYVTVKVGSRLPARERACEPSSPELAQGSDGNFRFTRPVCKVIQYITASALLLYYIEECHI